MNTKAKTLEPIDKTKIQIPTQILAKQLIKSPTYATAGQIETWLICSRWYIVFNGTDHKTYCKGDMEIQVPKHKLTNRESFDIAYNIVLQYEKHSVTTRYSLSTLLDDLRQEYSDDIEITQLEEAS